MIVDETKYGSHERKNQTATTTTMETEEQKFRWLLRKIYTFQFVHALNFSSAFLRLWLSLLPFIQSVHCSVQ